MRFRFDNRWLSVLFSIVAASVLPFMSAMLFEAPVFRIVLACIVCAILCYFSLQFIFKNGTRRLAIISSIGGFLFSLALYVGRSIFLFQHFSLSLGDIVKSGLIILAFTPFTTAITGTVILLLPKVRDLLLAGKAKPLRAAPTNSDGRGAEVLRFAIAGGVGFVIDYGVMVLLTEPFHMHFLLATGLAFLLSVVVNYLMCAYWVFQGTNTKSGGVKAGFVLTSVIGLVLNELLMLLFVDVCRIHYMIAKLIAVVLVMIWNYFSKRKVLVRKTGKAHIFTT